MVLDGSVPGDVYQLNSNTSSLSVTATKISATSYESCNSEDDSMELSYEYVQQTSQNGTYFMDCLVLISPSDFYLSEDSQSDSLLLTVSADTETSDDDEDAFTLLDECSPILISFNATSFEDGAFPLCSYFNESFGGYDTEGCMVYQYNTINEESVEVTTHTTWFNVKSKEFEPQVHFISCDFIYNDLTWGSIQQYPLGLVSVTLWICFCVAIMLIMRQSNICMTAVYDNPLILHQTAMFSKDKIQQRKEKKNIQVLKN